MQKDAVTEKFSATAKDGKNYLTQFDSLDAIISVGYRVDSKATTSFRIWATKVLKEYIKGIYGTYHGYIYRIKIKEVFQGRKHGIKRIKNMMFITRHGYTF